MQDDTSIPVAEPVITVESTVVPPTFLDKLSRTTTKVGHEIAHHTSFAGKCCAASLVGLGTIAFGPLLITGATIHALVKYGISDVVADVGGAAVFIAFSPIISVDAAPRCATYTFNVLNGKTPLYNHEVLHGIKGFMKYAKESILVDGKVLYIQDYPDYRYNDESTQHSMDFQYEEEIPYGNVIAVLEDDLA